MGDIKKALGMPGSWPAAIDAANPPLMQVEIDRMVEHLVEWQNPIRQNMPRKPGSGDGAYLNRRTPSATAHTGAGASFVNDTEEPSDAEGSYDQIKFPFKTILARGKVTRKLQAVGKTYGDILADEIEARSEEFKDTEDWCLINGNADDATLPFGHPVNAKQFSGLDVLVPSTQRVLTTTASGGDDVTTELMDEVIDTCIGDPDMIVCTKRTSRRLNALLQITQRFVEKTEVKGGFRLRTYDDIPIYKTLNALNTQTFDGTSVSACTGSTTSSLYVIDTSKCYMEVLTETSTMPLAKTSSQFDQFDIFCDEVMVLRNYLYCAILIGIK